MSGPGFESGFLHNDPDALQDNCVILYFSNCPHNEIPFPTTHFLAFLKGHIKKSPIKLARRNSRENLTIVCSTLPLNIYCYVETSL